MIPISKRCIIAASSIDAVIKYAPSFSNSFDIFNAKDIDDMDLAISAIQAIKGYFTRAISTYSKKKSIQATDISLEPIMRRVKILDESLKLAYKQRGSLFSGNSVKIASNMLYGPVQTKTRYCPDHVGVGVVRLSDDYYQCPLDGREYNYVTGFEKLDGDKNFGGSVNNQIIKDNILYSVVPKPQFEVIKI